MSIALHGSPSARACTRKALCVALWAILFGTPAATAESGLPADIPLQWPLPFERSAGTPPLRARLDAMRVHHPRIGAGTPQVHVVTTCADDDSPTSLRSLIQLAASGDTIDLSQLQCSTISLDQGALKIEVDDLRLRGPGAGQLTLDAGQRDRVILHPASGTLTIEDLSLANGRFDAVDTDIGFGGCIATGANLVLTRSVVRDCMAVGVGAYGGAVLSGFLRMHESTISGSTAFGDHPTNGTAAYGGGVFAYGVEITRSTLTGNRAIGTDNAPLTHWEIAGGLFIARNGGTIDDSTISDNFAIRFAGGLTQEDELVLRNSTISGNRTEQDDGGGIRVRQSTGVRIENSTITGNHAGSRGGGISFFDNALPSTLSSSIIAGNSAGAGNADLASNMPLAISGSHDLIVDASANLSLPADVITLDPGLLPLADNGGPTRTHALPPDSVAIDAGINSNAFAFDQRGAGHPRSNGAGTDIGAYELQGQAEAVSVPGLGGFARALLAAVLGGIGIASLRPRRRPRCR